MHKVGGDDVPGKATEDDEKDEEESQERRVPVFKKFEKSSSFYY